MSIHRHVALTTLRDSHSGTKANKGANDAASVALVEFAQQLLLQMSPRSLFDRATFVGYSLLLCLAFPPGSRFHKLRHVPDLWASRADFSLFWFCARIHELAPLICYEDNQNRSQLKNDGGNSYGQNRFIVAQSYRRTAQEPCHAESCIS
jgi:hypothetical protein